MGVSPHSSFNKIKKKIHREIWKVQFKGLSKYFTNKWLNWKYSHWLRIHIDLNLTPLKGDIKYEYFILLSSLLFRVSVWFKGLSLFSKILKDIPIIWPATAKEPFKSQNSPSGPPSSSPSCYTHLKNTKYMIVSLLRNKVNIKQVDIYTMHLDIFRSYKNEMRLL